LRRGQIRVAQFRQAPSKHRTGPWESPMNLLRDTHNEVPSSVEMEIEIRVGPWRRFRKPVMVMKRHDVVGIFETGA